jgi:endonuclease/exonuclease/phosphatase (EEP) superfamily protein YafD
MNGHTYSDKEQRMRVFGRMQEKSIKAFSKLLFTVHVLLSMYTLVAYVSVYVSPATFWPAGFVALSLPVVIIIHLIFFLYWLLNARIKALLPLAVILIGFPLYQRTLALHFEKPVIAADSTFKVLSFNARMFNLYKDKKSLRSNEVISWVADNDADIKCIQEFYNLSGSKIFSTIQKIAKKGNYQFYMEPLQKRNGSKGGFLGVTIFSKFPIVNKGEVVFEKASYKGIYVDVRVKKDTIRIFNVHLHSMSIPADSLFENENYAAIKETYLDVFKRLKTGFVKRSFQIAELEKHIKASPHKVIVCGDFNDIPYSYTYQKMRGLLNNSFEDAGRGFGFTYNGKLFFLRIDNQFYDKRLSVLDFYTHRTVPYSDHFPISAIYSLKPTEE